MRMILNCKRLHLILWARHGRPQLLRNSLEPTATKTLSVLVSISSRPN